MCVEILVLFFVRVKFSWGKFLWFQATHKNLSFMEVLTVNFCHHKHDRRAWFTLTLWEAAVGDTLVCLRSRETLTIGTGVQWLLKRMVQS